MGNNQNDEIEIDIMQIARLLWSKAVIIILTGIIFGITALLGSKFFLKPVYESTTNLYVLTRQNQGVTTFTDIQSSTQLTKDYKILVTSRAVTEKVISELKLDMTSEALAGSIQVNTTTDSRVLEIVVSNNDQYKAKEIADKVASISADSICSIMDIDKVNIIDEANFPTYPVSPNVKRNAVIAGLLGIILASAVIIAKFLLDDTVRTAEDIEKYFGMSTLALIPLSEEMYDGDGNKKKKKKKTSANTTRKQGER